MMATAGQAAANQDSFWEFHDWLFENQPARGAGTVTTEWLVDAAADLGLDAELFAADLADADETIWNSLVKDGREALNFAPPSTPVFTINGVVMVGAQPTAAFVDAISWAHQNTV